MKKVLIVSSSLSTGGLEKALINFCDNFDYEKYEVDLYLFNDGRDLINKLNKNVNLLQDSPYYSLVYNKSFGFSVKSLLKQRKLGLALYRIKRFIKSRLRLRKFTISDWKNMKKTMLKTDKHYDVAIGFEEGSSCYYVADCILADRKLGWIHTDISKINPNKKLDKKSFKKLDKVVTVSENSLNVLTEFYPTLQEKFTVVPIGKMLNYQEIDKLAQEEHLMDNSVTKILSVGRLVELKGFHLCVEPLKRLIDEGYSVKWYVAGEGDYRSVIEKEIQKYGVKDNFILLGNQPNPYTYIKNADICVQPSSYEGMSVCVLEEKHLQKPVVVTNIPSNMEMIENDVNGKVINRNSEEIYLAVKDLLDNLEKTKILGETPIKGNLSNREIMEQIENLF